MLSLISKAIAVTIISTLVFAILMICIAPMTTQHIVLGCGGDTLAICKMDPLDHISHLQHLFTSIIPQILLVVGLSILTLFLYLKYQDKYNNDLNFKFYSFKVRQRDLFLNYFKYAFSQGILNPKVF